MYVGYPFYENLIIKKSQKICNGIRRPLVLRESKEGLSDEPTSHNSIKPAPGGPFPLPHVPDKLICTFLLPQCTRQINMLIKVDQ